MLPLPSCYMAKGALDWMELTWLGADQGSPVSTQQPPSCRDGLSRITLGVGDGVRRRMQAVENEMCVQGTCSQSKLRKKRKPSFSLMV